MKDDVFSDGAKSFCESAYGRPNQMDAKSSLFGKYRLLTEPESNSPGDIRDFPTYYYGVRWLPNCVLRNEPQSQGFQKPLGDSAAESCQSIFTDIYNSCKSFLSPVKVSRNHPDYCL